MANGNRLLTKYRLIAGIITIVFAAGIAWGVSQQSLKDIRAKADSAQAELKDVVKRAEFEKHCVEAETDVRDVKAEVKKIGETVIRVETKQEDIEKHLDQIAKEQREMLRILIQLEKNGSK